MSRREDVYRRVASGTNRPANPDKAKIRGAIQTITSLPQWAIVLDYLDLRERQQTALSDEGDAGALLRAAGRRSLFRELERLDERVTDDDRSDHSE
jgi:hypothetical protein